MGNQQMAHSLSYCRTAWKSLTAHSEEHKKRLPPEQYAAVEGHLSEAANCWTIATEALRVQASSTVCVNPNEDWRDAVEIFIRRTTNEIREAKKIVYATE